MAENITSNRQFQQASRSVWLNGCNYNLSLQSGKRSCVSVMEFEWDEAKRLTNLRKHGIDFIDILAVFDGDTVTVEDDRYSYTEQRFVTFGLLQGRVVAVVHTDRDDLTRIISARKATKYEQRIYFEQLSD
ncbi:BrnT family toxin [Nostoc sp.]|uniref:BrnT family toxin n=2 Tax=Nostoc TaxID=1177 RepID=UPI002FF4A77B